ncbi:hypothetical protein WN51_13152 [Melipona quadrifasciata]|uniref:Uncharacterized protein n=1 Tax=Melipona quadrifasciata TaxID=166423 RepID=A0A0M9A0L7_9HYME|nr:hypothetical protein WN51_13152 [Melipona quadrifasciata]
MALKENTRTSGMGKTSERNARFEIGASSILHALRADSTSQIPFKQAPRCCALDKRARMNNEKQSCHESHNSPCRICLPLE